MRVLVACEFSGIVRDAFRDEGHEAYSCDLLYPRSKTDFHIMCDVRDILGGIDNQAWDLMIAHPPCTYLASSGARWFKHRITEQTLAVKFVRLLMEAPIHKIAIENPIGILSKAIRKPNQIIQPWMFGHGETKATCLWLKNLPKLVPTNIVEGREAKIHRASPGRLRSRQRSIFYIGIAQAMATQWGKPVRNENATGN